MGALELETTNRLAQSTTPRALRPSRSARTQLRDCIPPDGLVSVLAFIVGCLDKGSSAAGVRDLESGRFLPFKGRVTPTAFNIFDPERECYVYGSGVARTLSVFDSGSDLRAILIKRRAGQFGGFSYGATGSVERPFSIAILTRGISFSAGETSRLFRLA